MGTRPNVLIYCDGACVPNPGAMGIGVVLISGDHRREISEYIGLGTNQAAEIHAARRGLEVLRMPCNVTVISDSQYLVRTMNGDWKAKTNLEAWGALQTVANQHDVEWVWVKGHNGTADNERADQLANDAVGGVA